MQRRRKKKRTNYVENIFLQYAKVIPMKLSLPELQLSKTESNDLSAIHFYPDLNCLEQDSYPNLDLSMQLCKMFATF